MAGAEIDLGEGRRKSKQGELSCPLPSKISNLAVTIWLNINADSSHILPLQAKWMHSIYSSNNLITAHNNSLPTLHNSFRGTIKTITWEITWENPRGY